MKLAFIYGRRFSGGANAFDVANLYKTKGLTGSESFFFNTARGLADLGHAVQVFCDATEEIESSPALGGAQVIKLDDRSQVDGDIDAVLSWNEPDILRMVPPTALRICSQQVNDFSYCFPGWQDAVDLYTFPSEAHRAFMVKTTGIDPAKTLVVPNSINLEFYGGTEKRRKHSVAYCSSPDRGLHWLLEYWPHVRKRVPDAELRVYYKVQSWLDGARPLWFDPGLHEWWESGFRARYVQEALHRLGRAGENGVHLIGPMPNTELARELMKTEVLAYTCDTLRWSEGFSVTIMDACAAGVVPLISDVDAIGEVYGQVAHVIPGRPTSLDQRWIDAIVRALTDDEFGAEVRSRTLPFVQQHSRQIRAKQWERILLDALAQRGKAAA